MSNTSNRDILTRRAAPLSDINRKVLDSKSALPASTPASAPAEQLVLSEAQVLPSAKDTKEKLLMIHDEYKARLDQLMNQLEKNESETFEDQMILIHEEFAQLKILLGRIQLGVYDSHLLITLVEYLQILESCRSKLRLETRRLAHENNVLRKNIQALQEDIFDKEAELSAVHVERDHWMFMCNMAKVDAAVALEKEEQEIWDSTIYPETAKDITPNVQKMGNELKAIYEKMAARFLEGKVKEAVALIQNHIDRKKGGRDEAALLSLAARHCTEKNMYDESLKLLNKALDFRLAMNPEIEEQADADELVVMTQNNIALVHWKKGKMKEAAESVYAAFKVLEKKVGKEDNAEMAKQYLRTGFLVSKWKYTEDGIKLMELAILMLENLLPNEELSWLIAITKLVRACNDITAYEDSLSLCCEAIDFFHESTFGQISDHNKPIYEIAAEHQACEASGDIPPDLPPAVSLPEPIVSILRELAIVFTSYFLFTGAHAIDKWLEECMEKADPRETVKATDRVYELLGKNGEIGRRLSAGKAYQMPKPKVKHGKKGGCLQAQVELALSLMSERPGRERILETSYDPSAKNRRGLFQQVNARLNAIFKKN